MKWWENLLIPPWCGVLLGGIVLIFSRTGLFGDSMRVEHWWPIPVVFIWCGIWFALSDVWAEWNSRRPRP